MTGLLALLFAVNDMSSALELEKAAFEYRFGIHSGHLELHSVVTVKRDGGSEERITRRRVMYFDGENLREDQEHVYEGRLPPGVTSPTYWERRALTKEGHLFYTSQVDRRGQLFGSDIRHPDAIRSALDANITEPRWLGMTAMDSIDLKQTAVRTTFDRPDVTVREFAEDPRYGASCKRIDYVRRDGVHGSLWIDLAKGPSIVGDLVESATKVTAEEMHAQLTLHEPSGLWFPTHCSYTYKQHGKVVEREELTIRIISLGQPLPGDTFTFVGLGLEPGREVSPIGFPNDTYQKLWTGRKLVSAHPSDQQFGQISPWWHWIFGGSAVIAAVIALIVLYRRSLGS